MIHDAESLIQAEEGRTNVAKRDTRGRPFIGIGHDDPALIPGVTRWTDAQVDAQFQADYTHARDGIAHAWHGISGLDPVRCAYLVSMAFQLGVGGVLTFSRMLSAAQAGQWRAMHDAALASDWHEQTPNRCNRAAMAFLTGQWQQIP